MEIIFLALSCVTFFIYSSIVTSRFIMVIKTLNFSSLQILIITILTHLGHLLGVMLYDIAKKSSIIKFFIGASILFASLQIALFYIPSNFTQVAIITLILYACYNLIDLCCNILGRYIPLMSTVLLRNFSSLIAAAINARINYVNNIQGKNLILYLTCASILSILYMNFNVKMKASINSVSFNDLSILSREYKGIFWSFIFTNIVEILLLKYLVLFIHTMSNKDIIPLHLELSFYLGRLLLHYPIFIILSNLKSKWKIIISILLSLILMILIPICCVKKYVIITITLMFFLGGLSLIRHGLSIFFTEQLHEEHKFIPLDTALNKIRSICFLLSFILEITFITGWNTQSYLHFIAYTIFIILQIISLIFLVLYKQYI